MNGDNLDARILEKLFTVIESRRNADPGSSYTARLLSKGRAKIAKKTGEEAVEVVVAALSRPLMGPLLPGQQLLPQPM